jgi:TRAP-type uncharacterized transport system substrate-binding protein
MNGMIKREETMIKTLVGASLALGLLASTASSQALLTAETGPPGTVPFTAMTVLAEIASAEGIADFQIADSQTATNSLQNLAEGKTDVSISPLILTFLMSKGAGPYAKLGAEKGSELVSNVRVLHTYNYGGFGLYAYNSSSVKGWDDVAGKTILNGPPRGAALTNDRGILQLVSGVEDGKDYKGIQVNWGQMAKTITDGSADAMMLPVTFPDTRITRSLAAGDMTLWSIPKDIWEGEAMQKYIKSPGTAGLVFDLSDIAPVKGLTIVSEDGVWRSPTTVGAEVVNASMDFETAKALTAAVIANTDTFLNKAPYMATTNVGSVGFGLCGAVPVKYHPGAVAAYEEAGMTVPDCAKP